MEGVRAATSRINPHLSGYLGMRFTYLEVKGLGMLAPRVSARSDILGK